MGRSKFVAVWVASECSGEKLRLGKGARAPLGQITGFGAPVTRIRLQIKLRHQVAAGLVVNL